MVPTVGNEHLGHVTSAGGGLPDGFWKWPGVTQRLRHPRLGEVAITVTAGEVGPDCGRVGVDLRHQ